MENEYFKVIKDQPAFTIDELAIYIIQNSCDTIQLLLANEIVRLKSLVVPEEKEVA